jgi:hypothetical protein
MSQPAFFHEESACVRFWVQIGAGYVGASISRSVLHYHYCPGVQGEDPLKTYIAHAEAIGEVVRSRVARGSIEPVMVREHDLRTARG